MTAAPSDVTVHASIGGGTGFTISVAPVTLHAPSRVSLAEMNGWIRTFAMVSAVRVSKSPRTMYAVSGDGPGGGGVSGAGHGTEIPRAAGLT